MVPGVVAEVELVGVAAAAHWAQERHCVGGVEYWNVSCPALALRDRREVLVEARGAVFIGARLRPFQRERPCECDACRLAWCTVVHWIQRSFASAVIYPLRLEHSLRPRSKCMFCFVTMVLSLIVTVLHRKFAIFSIIKI
jgi:hypothetical protein